MNQIKLMKLNEQLLQSWLQLTNAINNERLVSDLPFNELVIYRYLLLNEPNLLTATDLCNMTKMQKSQMNRTLISMENKQLIQRIKDSNDRRKVFIQLNQANHNVYQNEHAKILNIIDRLIECIGVDKANQVLQIFNLVAEVANKEINND